MGIGDCQLDLRTAELDGDEVTVTVVQMIGDTTIVVPQHVDVELSGLLLIGDKSRPGLGGGHRPFGAAGPRPRFGLIGELNVVRR